MVDNLYTRDELQEIFQYDGDGHGLQFEEVTTSMVNAAFRQVVDADHVAPTSYSARRAFIQEAFEHTNGDREKLRDMTLHFTDQVIRAHYVDWFVYTERRAEDVPEDLVEDPHTAKEAHDTTTLQPKRNKRFK